MRSPGLVMTKRTMTLGKETERVDMSSSYSNKNQETCKDLQAGHGLQPVEIENRGMLRGYFSYPKADFPPCSCKNIISKNVFSGFLLQIYLRNEKELSSKNNFINDKKIVSAVTKLPPSVHKG